MNLKEIAKKHNRKTDKGNEIHSFKGLSYLDIYQKYFESLKDKKINILEIGVLGGGSLRTWKEFFPNAEIRLIKDMQGKDRITIIINK